MLAAATVVTGAGVAVVAAPALIIAPIMGIAGMVGFTPAGIAGGKSTRISPFLLHAVYLMKRILSLLIYWKRSLYCIGTASKHWQCCCWQSFRHHSKRCSWRIRRSGFDWHGSGCWRCRCWRWKHWHSLDLVKRQAERRFTKGRIVKSKARRRAVKSRVIAAVGRAREQFGGIERSSFRSQRFSQC